jgi:hypothetical protein
VKQLDLDRDRTHTTADSQMPEAIAPGRRSASAELKSTDTPVVSGLLMRKARDANGVTANADAAVATAASSSGSALPDTLKSKFESSLGTDLSSVRVHTGAESATAAGAVGAKAYTLGNDIHFGAGHFDSSSASGQHLIAHEVAHTVQQRGGSPRRQNKLEVSAPGDAFEHAADAAADAMVAGRRASVGGASRTIARDLDKDMVDAGTAGADYQGADAKVQTIEGHSVTADEGEARRILSDIAGTERLVTSHPTAQVDNRTATNKIGPLRGYLVENHQASAVIEHYLATVSDSGNYQSQFAASYQNSKRDYGQG